MINSNNFFVAFFLTMTSLHAQDLGSYGEVFEIIEADLLKVIELKLAALQADGTLESHNKKALAVVKKGLQEPKEVQGITNTITPRSFYYDPSITLNTDLMDQEGRVFYKKGNKVNPLDFRAMTKPFIFIDGSNELHCKQALGWLKIHPLAKIILVKGKPLSLTKQLGLTVYFDQFGKITTKLGITQVPALVTQKGNKLLIEEVLADA